MKTYLAGKMTGLPEYNFPAFFAAEEVLTAQGWDVVSPAKHDVELGIAWEGTTGFETEEELGENYSFKEAILWDLQQVADADAIHLLPGWETSRGANLEKALADLLGKLVFYIHEEAVLV